MDLLADLGNTRAHLALVSAAGIVDRADVPNEDGEDALTRACDALVERHGAPRRAALVAVSPRLRGALEAWSRGRGLEPLALGETLPVPIPVKATGVGPDRLADGVWAALEHPGRATLVVDAGTALTLNVVSARGVFLGGAIGPGLRTQAWSLAQRTARLPLVDLPLDLHRTAAIGLDTERCIRSALLWGAVGLVTTYADQVELVLRERPLVVATGGDAARLAPACPRIEQVVADLTLRGLHRALVAHAGEPAP